MRILIVASLCLHYFLLIFASDVAIWRSLTQFGDIPSPDSDPLFAYDSHSQIVWFIGGDDLSTAFFTNQYLRYGRLNFDSGEYAVTWTNTSFSFPYHITAGGMSLFQRVDPSDNSNMLSSLIYYYGFGQYDTQVAYCDEIVMLQVSVLFFFPVYLTRCDCCLQYRTSVNQSLASSSPSHFPFFWLASHSTSIRKPCPSCSKCFSAAPILWFDLSLAPFFRLFAFNFALSCLSRSCLVRVCLCPRISPLPILSFGSGPSWARWGSELRY